MKFRVVLFYALTFVDGSTRGAAPKSQIPQHARKFSDQRPEFCFGFLVSKKKKDIQVGVGKQMPPSITAQRQQGKPLRVAVMDAQDLAENALDGPVRQFAQRAQRFARAHARFELLADS